ncbi:MAG: hypothetical protein M3Q16_05910 [Pseudomonadota bacterium]|nr:hypothetical protein [Pseudomonadota bacterium]
MRYLAGVMFLASCAMLTPTPVEDQAVEQPAPVASPEVNAEPSENTPEVRKPKPKPAPPPAPPSPPPTGISSCANLNAGDLKETIKAKLDCITENAK